MDAAAIHELEKQALALHRQAVLQFVSAARRMRQAAETLLLARYQDGECDAVALTTFALALDAAWDDACDSVLSPEP